MQIKGFDDLAKFDVNQLRALDPSQLKPQGIDLPDCALIAQTFERGSHSIASEPAVFATLNRSLENTIQFSSSASQSLKGYLRVPQEDAINSTVTQAADFGAEAAPDLNAGSQGRNDNSLKSFNFGNTQSATVGNSFGDKMLQFARDCIPCSLRLATFLELHPNVDLIGILEADVLRRLKLLQDIVGLFTNFDIYGDFCELMNLLSFMCIPDLQRIIALLMALMMLELPTLDGLIGLLQALIGPIFAPLLMAITSLLDQFVLMVTNPLECIIDAINQQLAKLGFEIAPDSPIEQASAGISSGLSELNNMLTEAKQAIKDKLNFYIQEVEALLGELGGGDSAYGLAGLKKLKIIRMIAFVTALIRAIASGHAACNSAGRPPEQQELDHFFDNFLHPNAPFIMYTDPDTGDIVIDEKPPPGDTLPNDGNVLEFEGTTLVDTSAAQTIEQISATLTSPITTTVPCRLEVTAADAEKVNQFVSELNQL